jgi:hypothetical protein
MDYVSARPLGDEIRKFLKKSNIRRYKPISVKDRNILEEIYRPYNQKLAEFTGRDLSTWN